MDLKILMIDDEKDVTDTFKEIFDQTSFQEHKIELTCENDFSKGMQLIETYDFDLLILDLCRGEPVEENPDKPGEYILEEIRKKRFMPIIFFTGLVPHVQHLETEFIKVIRKSATGNEELISAINSFVENKIILLKKKINNYVTEKTREYFWDFIQNNWNSIKNIKDNVSLGYLLIRRLANSFSKDKAIRLLDDPKINEGKVHPMEFYIYPVLDKEDYETGTILKKDQSFFVILTPSCDLVLRDDGKRKAESILIAECIALSETKEFKKYQENTSKNNKKELLKLIESRKTDRFFFLPGTVFIDNLLIDFQRTNMIKSEDLGQYENFAKLDYPFAESMLSSFIRYYNRIGFPDLDSELVLSQIDKEITNEKVSEN